MQEPALGPWRALRCVALAVVVLAVSGAAHTAGGAQLPGPALLAGLGVVVSCVAAVLTRWRLSTGTLVAVLGGGQVLLHQALSALSVSPCAEVVARPSGHAGHSGAALAVRSCPVPDAAAHHAVASSVPSMAMLAAHVAATVVIAVVLARGERLVWDLWVSLTPLVALLLLRVALPSRQMRTTPTHQLPSPRPVRVPGAPRRGPPARLRAAAALGA